jgi:hypothetical protein
MNGVTRRFMRKMRGATRRLKRSFQLPPSKSHSYRKFMRGIRQRGGQGATGTTTYLIKVPAGKINFDFSKAVSSLPETFGTFVPGGVDDHKFVINLNSKYTSDNLPQFLVTGYVYNNIRGYIQVQRQFGIHSAVAAAGIEIDTAVKTIKFANITRINFPYTINDSKGFALYIAFQILN